jgi:hypothetical protein
MQDVHVVLVEEFRGKECKLVLLSTVYQEDSWSCTAEYISVMLTRAQEGLYVIGNLQQLTRSSTTWCVVQKTLVKHGVVGTQLLLRCQVGSHIQNFFLYHVGPWYISLKTAFISLSAYKESLHCD